MKKLFLLFILFFSSIFPHYFISFADTSYYAKIQDDNVYFYSMPIKSNQYYVFSIPRTYFVLLLNDENQDFYYAKYKNIYGYVLKNEVSVMQGTPASPFASASFRVFSPDGLGVYSMPYQNSNRLTVIPYLAEDIEYYGSLYGEQAIPDKSQEWYYCAYNKETLTYGYVYSVFCDKLPVIQENHETFKLIETPSFKSDYSKQNLSYISMTFIIIAVSLPCVIVIYLLLKPTFIKQKTLSPSPKPRKRKGDYFEFDDGDLN